MKATLSAIPLYEMSFRILPKAVEKTITSLMRNFLLGGNSGVKKIAWVKWEDICKPFSEGGLGLKNLGAFNKALVGKWVWKFMEGKERLWQKVVKARHEVPSWLGRGKRMDEKGRNSSGWWGKVLRLVEGRDGGWFRDKLKQKLGDERVALFWEGAWSGQKTMKEKFPQLFQVSTLCEKGQER